MEDKQNTSFLRKAWCEIYDNGSKMADISGVDIKFNLRHYANNDSMGTVSFLNLNKEHELALMDKMGWDWYSPQGKPSQIRLKLFAGYDESVPGQKCGEIGDMMVTRTTPSMPPDRWTQCQVVPFGLDSKTYQITLNSGKDPTKQITGQQIFDEILLETEHDVKADFVSEDIKSKFFGNSVTINGTIRDVMNYVRSLYSKPNEVSVYLKQSADGGNDIIVQDYSNAPAVTISAGNGMIGLPTMESKAHGSVCVQLDPTVKLFDKIIIDCKRFNLIERGEWCVLGIEHMGQLLGGQWQTKLLFAKRPLSE